MAVDRISTLPDEVLHHILSFLPTEMAAATSILSKRWKPLWLSVPALFFDDNLYIIKNKPHHRFTKSIYAAIVIREVPINYYDFDVNVDYYIPSFGSLSKLVRADIHHVAFYTIVECFGIDKYLENIPLFPNLTHMELICGYFDMEWHLVPAMLKQCPMLQNFVLDIQTSTDSEDVVWISPSFVPECLSSQLEKCSIINYKGKSELHFAKYIMQNSGVLRTMTIRTPCSSELKVDKLELLKELSLCPRGSTICKLSFK